MANYLGLDLSLRNTGYCILEKNETGFKNYETGVIHIKDSIRGAKRLDILKLSLQDILTDYNFKGCAVEGYAMGIRGGKLADIGEWGGIARLELYYAGINTIIVPPMNLKKFMNAGTGKMEKSAILLQVFKQYGITCENDDEADAIVLAEMANSYFSKDNKLLKYKQEALEKVSLYHEKKKVHRKR